MDYCSMNRKDIEKEKESERSIITDKMVLKNCHR